MDPEEEPTVEETLRREKALLEALIENVPEGIVIVSPEGQFLYYNQHFLDMWKLPREILESADDGEAIKWAAMQAADPEGFLARIKQVYHHPMESVLDEKVVMKDGRILCRFGTPVSEGGVHFGWLWTFWDVTKRLETERQLRESSQYLEQRVEERTRALEEQTERLRHLASELVSAEHRERKRLAAVLHDDLQQLLVAANMALNSLGRRLKEERDKADVGRVAAWVSQAGKAARDLAHELRPPALYEDGLIAALRWLAGMMLDRHQLQVTIRSNKPLPLLTDEINALLFDSTRELLFNVVKYAGVDRATVSVWEDGERLYLAVADNGAGFSNKPGTGGKKRGFGLFSIRERMLGLGGEMTVDSRPGRGTNVVLAVPIEIATAKKTAAPVVPAFSSETGGEPETPRDGGEIRVLVVDDHVVVRQGIANILRGEKRILVVGEANDGLAAIEAVEEMRPEVVLMDINMPRMNGIEATREIHRRWPEKIIIGLSVQDDDATRASMFVSGAQDFLCKTGDANVMVSTILKLNDAANGGNAASGGGM